MNGRSANGGWTYYLVRFAVIILSMICLGQIFRLLGFKLSVSIGVVIALGIFISDVAAAYFYPGVYRGKLAERKEPARALKIVVLIVASVVMTGLMFLFEHLDENQTHTAGEYAKIGILTSAFIFAVLFLLGNVKRIRNLEGEG